MSDLLEIVIGGHVVELTAAECRQLAERLLNLVDAESDHWHEGVILSYCKDRGYGFVRRTANGREFGDGLYFHITRIDLPEHEIEQGRPVLFTLQEAVGRHGGKICVAKLKLA